jgi:hypothetical protein
MIISECCGKTKNQKGKGESASQFHFNLEPKLNLYSCQGAKKYRPSGSKPRFKRGQKGPRYGSRSWPAQAQAQSLKELNPNQLHLVPGAGGILSLEIKPVL